VNEAKRSATALAEQNERLAVRSASVVACVSRCESTTSKHEARRP